jgi:hypothetical protein
MIPPECNEFGSIESIHVGPRLSRNCQPSSPAWTPGTKTHAIFQIQNSRRPLRSKTFQNHNVLSKGNIFESGKSVKRAQSPFPNLAATQQQPTEIQCLTDF